MTFTAGWNQPGYLPDSPPEVFDTFDDAKRYIIDALKMAEDAICTPEEEDDAEALCHLAEDTNLEAGPFEVSAPDGWVYWVMDYPPHK